MSETIGILPAAGRASRLGLVPCSKEIMPLGFEVCEVGEPTRWRPVTAIERHLRSFHSAGVERVAVVISDQKYDIIRYLGDGQRYGVSIGYFFQQDLRGMPFALDLISNWAGDANVVFAMPDTYIEPVDTLGVLADHHRKNQPDVSLGLFETTTPWKFGMVDLDRQGRPVTFVDKPRSSPLRHMWGLAAWSVTFTVFLSRFLKAAKDASCESVLSDVLLAGLRSGMRIETIAFNNASYRDIGTAEDFQAVVYELAYRPGLTSAVG